MCWTIRLLTVGFSISPSRWTPTKRSLASSSSTPGDFDLFECWVGVAKRPHQGRTRFIIKGDGNVLYRSLWMTWRDQAERVSVNIKNYKGITLVAEGDGMSKFDMAIWGEPTLVQLLPPAETGDDLQLPRADVLTVTRFADGAIGVMVNGESVAFGRVRPIDESGRLLVPMRPIFEALGARVSYNAATRQVTATRDDQKIVLSIGSTSASINGRPTSMDVPARASAGETLIPLRFVAEALGVPVEYRR